MQVSRLRQQSCDRGLARAGGPPEHQRPHRAGVQEAPERPVGPEQVILTDDLVEPRRPQLVSEGPRRVVVETGGREQICAPALEASRHPRNSTDICWPPRMMLMLQRRLCWPVARSRSRVLAILVLLTDSTRSPR